MLTKASPMDMNHLKLQALKTLLLIQDLANLPGMTANLLATAILINDILLLQIRATVLNRAALIRDIRLGPIHLTAVLARALTMGIVLGRGQISPMATKTLAMTVSLGLDMETRTLALHLAAAQVQLLHHLMGAGEVLILDM